MIQSKQKSIEKLMNLCEIPVLRKKVIQASNKLKTNKMPGFFSYLAYQEAQWMGTKLWKEVPIIIEGISFTIDDRKKLAKLNKAYAHVRSWAKNLTNQKNNTERNNVTKDEINSQIEKVKLKKMNNKEKKQSNKKRKRIQIVNEDSEDEMEEKGDRNTKVNIEVIKERGNDKVAKEEEVKTQRMDNKDNELEEVKKEESNKIGEDAKEKGDRGVEVEDLLMSDNEGSSGIVCTTMSIEGEGVKGEHFEKSIEQEFETLQKYVGDLENIKDNVMSVYEKAMQIEKKNERIKYRMKQLILTRQRIAMTINSISSFRVKYKENDEERFMQFVKDFEK